MRAIVAVTPSFLVPALAFLGCRGAAQPARTIPEAALVVTVDAGARDGGGPAADVEGVELRELGSMLGVDAVLSPVPVNARLVVDVGVLRQRMFAPELGTLLRGLFPWRDVLVGPGSSFDPLRDTDWLLVHGPVVGYSRNAAVVLRYSVSDDVVDAALDAFVQRSARGGGRLDLGVPGVLAWGESSAPDARVFIRSQSHLLASVQKEKAGALATALAAATVSRPASRAALGLTVHNPSTQLTIAAALPELKELRVSVVPADGAADIVFEGDCADAAAAQRVADALSKALPRNMLSDAATLGLLRQLVFAADGSRVVATVHVDGERLDFLVRRLAERWGSVDSP